MVEVGAIYRDTYSETEFAVTDAPDPFADGDPDNELVELRRLGDDEVFTVFADTFRENHVRIAASEEDL